MGTPTQGVGTTTPWSDDGSGYDAGPYDLPNDGSQWSFSTVMLLIARLINSVGGVNTGKAAKASPTFTGTVTLPGYPALTGSPSVTRAVRGRAHNTTGTWEETFNSGPGWLHNATNYGAAGALAFPLEVPDGASITSAKVRYTGASGHGALPVSMPGISVVGYDYTGTVTGSIMIGVDASASTGAYEVAHDITTTTGGPIVVDNATYAYYLVVTPENGTNKAVGASTFRPVFTYTLPALKPV